MIILHKEKNENSVMSSCSEYWRPTKNENDSKKSSERKSGKRDKSEKSCVVTVQNNHEMKAKGINLIPKIKYNKTFTLK